jgi:hypothetical protein
VRRTEEKLHVNYKIKRQLCIRALEFALSTSVEQLCGAIISLTAHFVNWFNKLGPPDAGETAGLNLIICSASTKKATEDTIKPQIYHLKSNHE